MNRYRFYVGSIAVAVCLLFLYGRLNDSYKKQKWEADRDNWIANFPYVPTYHPSIKYSGKPKTEEELNELFSEHHNSFSNLLEKRLFAHTFDETIAYDEPIRILREKLENLEKPHHHYAQLIEHHGFMKQFFSTALGHTKEFSMLYEIFNSESISSPIALGKTFTNIIAWSVANSQDPSSLHPTIVSFPAGIKITIDSVPRRLTWGQVTENQWINIVNTLISPDNHPYQTPPTLQQAKHIRNRIVSEIPMRNMIKYDHLPKFAYHKGFEDSLTEGDSLLIPVGPPNTSTNVTPAVNPANNIENR